MGITNNVNALLRNGWMSVNLSRRFSHQTLRLMAPDLSQQGTSIGYTPPRDVPGLSNNVVKASSGKVGPGASKDSEYKHPEYFCFDQVSYYEAEIEMNKFRLPQPSNKN